MTRDPDQTDARTRVGERVTIYKRGKKEIYCAEFSLDGKHRRRTLKTRSLRVARRRAAEIDAELAAGTFKRQPPKITIDDAAKQYLAHSNTENLAKRTLVKYSGELKLFANFARRHHVLQLARVTVGLLDQYRSSRKVQIAAKTLYTGTVIIKQFLTWSLSRGLIVQNPIANYKLTKPLRIPRPVPTLPEVNAILQQCNPRLARHVILLVCSGLRSGELQGLRKKDIDLAAGFVHVRQQVDGPTKSGQERKVPVHPCIRPILCRLLAADDHQLLLTAMPSNRYHAGGRPINTKKLNDRFKAAAKRAGNEGFVVHSLRHCFNTTCINAGVPLPMVRRWMGHSVATMSEHYYDASDAESLRQMAKMPFDGLVVAREAAKGDLPCTGVRRVS